MSETKLFRLRDIQGNIYGPADIGTLRQWVGEGRIVAGMSLAEEGTSDWREVSEHPGLADLFGQAALAVAVRQGQPVQPAGGEMPQAASSAPHDILISTRREVTVSYAVSAGQPSSAIALISMIMGIVGLPLSIPIFCCGCGVLGFPLDVIAIVMGIIALRQIRLAPDRHGGAALAITGLICGGLGMLLLTALIAMFIIAAIMQMMGHPI